MARRAADEPSHPVAPRPLPSIKVVGVSAAGKSSLVASLRQLGYNAQAVSQEHSGVRDLWKQFGVPRVLIYLDATLDAQRLRRPDVTWDAANLAFEHKCLANARQAADLRINTADLAAAQVLALVLAFLNRRRIVHAHAPLPPAPRTGGSARPSP